MEYTLEQLQRKKKTYLLLTSSIKFSYKRKWVKDKTTVSNRVYAR